MEKLKPSTSLNLNINVFKLCGSWPPEDQNSKMSLFKLLVYRLVTLPFFICLTGVYFLSETINVVMISRSLDKLIPASFLFLTHVKETIKMVVFIKRSRRIQKLVQGLDGETFAPKYPEHVEIIKRTMWNVTRNIYTFIGLGVVTCALWSISPLLQQRKGKPKRLPLRAWYPFDTHDSPNYEMVFFYQIFCTTLHAFNNISMDSFIAGLIGHAAAQFEILQDTLKHIRERSIEEVIRKDIDIRKSKWPASLNGDNSIEQRLFYTTANRKNIASEKTATEWDLNASERGGRISLDGSDNGNDGAAGGVRERDEHRRKCAVVIDADALNETITRYFVKCVEHHKAILEYIYELKSVFSFTILAQIAINVLAICFTGLQLTMISPASLQFVSMILFLFCRLMEILLYCLNGNEVIVQSEGIPQAIYMSDWYLCDRRFKKDLRIMMERTKRPTTIMAGNFVTLSLITFVAVLRMSYSYFAVLQKVHNE